MCICCMAPTFCVGPRDFEKWWPCWPPLIFGKILTLNMFPNNVLINEKWIICVIIFHSETTLTVLHNDDFGLSYACWFDYAS